MTKNLSVTNLKSQLYPNTSLLNQIRKKSNKMSQVKPKRFYKNRYNSIVLKPLLPKRVVLLREEKRVKNKLHKMKTKKVYNLSFLTSQKYNKKWYLIKHQLKL